MMVIASALAMALAIGVQTGTDPVIPTAIERGLVERACKDSAEQPDVNEKCRDEKLTAMRTDFGKDLAKVKVDDRKKVDATCSPLLADAALKGRGPYFDCMLEQLTAITMRSRRKTANAAADAAPAPSDEPAAAPAPPPAPPSGMSTPTMIVATLGVVALGGVVAFVAMRSRGGRKPAMRKCKSCGADVPDAELCANCRREAAEALRRANAERVEQQRQAAEEARREQEREATRIEQAKMREVEAARVRAYDEQREREHASKVAEAVTPNAPELPAPTGYEEEPTDPHVILGVAPDASAEAIAAAYQQAKKKYDPDLVGHLSEEVQTHYREKAAAVEKAFQTLTSGPQPA
jgi:hypothetical protein